MFTLVLSTVLLAVNPPAHDHSAGAHVGARNDDNAIAERGDYRDNQRPTLYNWNQQSVRRDYEEQYNASYRSPQGCETECAVPGVRWSRQLRDPGDE